MDQSKELEPLLKALAAWAASTTARQDALETIIQSKSNVSDEDWHKALSAAKFRTQIPAQASKKIADLAKFLEDLAKRS